MDLYKNPSRRTFLKSSLGVLAPIAVSMEKSHPFGKLKVVALMGANYYHNPFAFEYDIRQIFKATAWDITFCMASRFLTPELLKTADLLLICKSGAPDAFGWSPDGTITERISPGDPFLTPEREDAIIQNIKDRGMGFVAFHCTFWNQPQRFKKMLGVEPIMHREIQPVILKDFNQNHPITKGIDEFYISLDEQFAAVMMEKDYTILFSTQAVHDKRDAIGGWCFDYGKGRVVVLLPGHTVDPWKHPSYRDIIWRSAFWALRRNIPPYQNA